MSVEAAIYTILKADGTVTALVGGAASPRIYPIGIPQGKSVPAVVYQQIAGDRPKSTGGTIGFCDALFQVTCWDDDLLGARALADAVRDALDDYTGTPVAGGNTIMQCSVVGEGDAINLDEAETADRIGKRLDIEVAYVD
jgi:hypothetical protein